MLLRPNLHRTNLAKLTDPASSKMTLDMPTAHPDDQLGMAIADVEHLIEIWRDLAASDAACAGIKALVGTKIENLKSPRIITSSSISFETFERLVTIRECLLLLGANHAIHVSTATLCKTLVEEKAKTHSTQYGVRSARSGRKRTELQQLESLDEWVRIKTVMETAFDNAAEAMQLLEKAISQDLNGLRSCSVVSDDAISLKLLELGAKVRKGLLDTDYPAIDRMISGKISSLKGSKNATFKVMFSPRPH